MLPGEKIRFELIGSLYEAAAYPDRWQDFLQLAVKQFAAERAGLTLHTDQKNTALTVQGVGFPAEATREYDAYYGVRNPLVAPYGRLIAKTGSWHGLARAVVGEREYKTSEFYNDFGRKYGSYWVVNGLVRNSLREVTTLSVMRSETARPLEQDAVDLMGLLMPHLRRVFKIHQIMESLRWKAAGAMTAVDALETGVLGVNGEGAVVLMNIRAEKIMRAQDGLMLRGKRLAATQTRETRELDSLVQSAAATGAGRGVHPGGGLLVSRANRRPLRVSVMPFHSSHMFSDVVPCALIFINDPDELPASRAVLLSTLYRLTPAECRLVDFLMEGLEVSAAAEHMRITSGTARFVLKNIFAKTGTHRQSELMRILLGLPNIAVPGGDHREDRTSPL